MTFDTWTVAGETTLHIDSTRIDECMNYFREAHLDDLSVNYARGYSLRDLEFLREHSDVRSLTLVLPPSGFDASAMSALRGLKRLCCNIPMKISPDGHPQLEEFRGKWTEGVDYSAFLRLRHLGLRDFAPSNRSLAGLASLHTLRELSLVSPRIARFDGLENLVDLRTLELVLVRSVADFRKIGQLTQLSKLVVESCRKIDAYDFLEKLTNLCWLELSKCPDIPSLAFMDHLPRLEHFAFVDTTIVDGDLTRLLRLSHAGFNGKSHYSHTPAQIEKLLAQRH